MSKRLSAFFKTSGATKQPLQPRQPLHTLTSQSPVIPAMPLKRRKSQGTSTTPKTDAAAAGTDTEQVGELHSSPSDAEKPVIKKRRSSFGADGVTIVRGETPRRTPPANATIFRILSVNVAGLRAVLNHAQRPKTLSEMIEKEKPDLICLNEHKLKEGDVDEWKRKLHELIPQYSNSTFSCSTAKLGYSGVAMLWRNDVKVPEVVEGFGGETTGDDIVDNEGRLLTAYLPDVSIVSAYVPNSGQDLKRLEYRTKADGWDRKFEKYINDLRSKRNGKPVIVIGDLNCCFNVRDMQHMYGRPNFPEELEALPIEDQYKGLKPLLKFAGLTPLERKSFDVLLAGTSLVDTYREQHKDVSGVFTYFSLRFPQNRVKNKGLRLDYVLADRSCISPHDLVDETSENEPDNDSKDISKVTVHDTFVLDESPLIADHVVIGCDLVLPSKQ